MSVRIITAELGSTFDLSSGVFHTLVSENMCQSSPGQLSMLYRPSSGNGDGLGVGAGGVALGVKLGVGVWLGLGGRWSGPLHRRSAR
jgi:hypothetical protein